METNMLQSSVEDARLDNYYTTVVLAGDKAGDCQFLLASQVYSTFFGVYGKFEVENGGTQTNLKKIDFRLINYKGLINIGIDHITHTYDSPNKELQFVLHLKGLMPLFQDFPYPFPDNGIVLSSDDKITFERKLKTFIQNPEGINEEVFTSGAFDEEFYFRDGLFPIKAPISDLEDRIEDEQSRPKIGTRCPKALVKIICG
jgi:hypothetical protein